MQNFNMKAAKIEKYLKKLETFPHLRLDQGFTKAAL